MEEVIQKMVSEKYKVEITKGQKDTYGWTVTVRGDNYSTVLGEARQMDNDLREIYKDKLGGS